MKQCPNPNCILYTRLEELPDAYTKCPGCGGQLVDASMTSGPLRSGYLTQIPSPGLGQMNMDEEFQEAFPDEDLFGFNTGVPPVASSVSSVPPAVPVRPQPHDDEYYPFDDTEQDESVQVQSAGLSGAAKAAYGLALLLLLAACGLFAFVLTTRILPSTAVTGAAATQTAIVAIRPAVNTPVAVMPTVPQSELPPVQPTSTVPVPEVVPPTQAPLPPTATVEQPQAQPPTQVPVQPPSGPATAPPAQQQPTGGVTNAQMVTSLASGEPVDNVQSYGANDPFVLAVQAQFGAGGVTTMRVRWYGPDGGLLYETSRDFTVPGTYYTGFTLKKTSAWVEGNYRADIHTNNSPGPAYSVSFSVRP